MNQDRREARLFLMSANRPPGDYTLRGIPRRMGSAVPLEDARIIVAASDKAHPSCRPTYGHRAAGWGRGGRQTHTCWLGRTSSSHRGRSATEQSR
jgi:hypothetical protein